MNIFRNLFSFINNLIYVKSRCGFIGKKIMGYIKFYFWILNEKFSEIGFNSKFIYLIKMNIDLEYVHIARHSYKK